MFKKNNEHVAYNHVMLCVHIKIIAKAFNKLAFETSKHSTKKTIRVVPHLGPLWFVGRVCLQVFEYSQAAAWIIFNLPTSKCWFEPKRRWHTAGFLRNENTTSWWLNHPFEKYESKWESSPGFGMKIKNIWVATTQMCAWKISESQLYWGTHLKTFL